MLTMTLPANKIDWESHPTITRSSCVICPNATEVDLVKTAISDGVITWHASPLNAELELADASLFESGIASTHALDYMFAVARKTVIAA
jgi:hypothetical protein